MKKKLTIKKISKLFKEADIVWQEQQNQNVFSLVDKNNWKDIFKKHGKRGGEARKKQNPDYSALGKKGAAKRWKK